MAVGGQGKGYDGKFEERSDQRGILLEPEEGQVVGVKARCYRSMRKHALPKGLRLLFNKKARLITAAQCSCVACRRHRRLSSQNSKTNRLRHPASYDITTPGNKNKVKKGSWLKDVASSIELTLRDNVRADFNSRHFSTATEWTLDRHTFLSLQWTFPRLMKGDAGEFADIEEEFETSDESHATTAPAEGVTAPAKGATAPTEGATAPTEGATALTEDADDLPSYRSREEDYT
ncbi:hypothetical protein Bbelb_272450 [Branchiostoma belcheri]|nr:hypothetical protein Bbelb_272450 [Branchiostoma belcheri]